jgi:hypothetical protein
MALDVQQMLNESFAALNEPEKSQEFVEKWVPEIVNEINDLRNRVVLQETQITELENDVAALGG